MQAVSGTGIRVRNQSVLISGVNDGFSCLHSTMRKLSRLLIEPYYLYLHDLVPACEHRTTVRKAEELSLRPARFHGRFQYATGSLRRARGGGKRDISSYLAYDEEIGISAWTSPTAKPGKVFYYYDPINLLPENGQALWKKESQIRDRLNTFKKEAESTPDS